jgi:hypothetical protein
MPIFRISNPVRTYTRKKLKHYRSYKKYLVIDFSNRCGYCDGSDTWTGGYRTYHIDHFAPKDKFILLENEYTNLIYSCPSCNSSKSNKWPSADPAINIVGDNGFLNPITDDFNVHFVRDNNGYITGNTAIAKDMVRSLSLGLERHSILWKLTSLENLIFEYETEIIKATSAKIRESLINIHYRLLKIFYEYHSRLRKINKN